MSFRELYFQMDACLRCGLCSEVCPVMRVRGLDRAPLLTVLFPAFGTRWDVYTLTDLLAQCSGCGACQEVCPQGIDIPAAVRWVRADAATKKGLHGPAVELRENILAQGNPWGLPRAERDKAFSQNHSAPARFLYFPGCQAAYRTPQVVAAWERVCQAAGLQFATLGAADSCCGSWLASWGEVQEARELARANAAAIAASGADTVVTSCPHCLQAFSKVYPELGVELKATLRHTTDLVRELVDFGRVKMKDQEAAVLHEPCYLRRQLRREGAHGVLASGGWRPLETETPLAPACCGAGEGVALLAPETATELAQKLVRSAGMLEAQKVVTACPHCLENLARAAAGRLEVIDVLELIQG